MTQLARYVSGRPWAGYVVALCLTALTTTVIALVRNFADVANISILYLLAVLITAIAFGSAPAILASVGAFFAFNFFFIQPTHRLNVSNTEEWLALGVLLITGVVTGELAAALRRRAREVERRRKEAIVLFDVVQLMHSLDIGDAMQAVAERLREELELAAAVVELQGEGPLKAEARVGEQDALRIASVPSVHPSEILSQVPATGRSGRRGRWIRIVPPRVQILIQPSGQERLGRIAIQMQGRQIGQLLLVRKLGAGALSRADDRLLMAVASQIGLAAERMRLREMATEAELLRRTDEVKTALLNAVSHDLKTPLASIIASAGSLLQQDVPWTEEEKHEFARQIEEEAGYLDRLVGNLLDLSRIEAGALRPDREWYDLGALVEDVLGRLQPLTRRHHIIVEIPEDLPPVPVDYLEIGDVLFNLAENATKYTPAGTEVRFSAQQREGEVQVKVEDNGPGLSGKDPTHLFDPFYRVGTAGLQAKGMGVGLAVAKGLVEAHGGRIWAENRPGGGARFTFTLPLKAPDSDPAEQKEDRE